MRDKTFWWVDTFMGVAATAGQMVVRVTECNGYYGLRSVVIMMVLVALPASAQVHGDSNHIGMLLVIILLVGGPALSGLAADGVVRLGVRLRNATIPLGASIPPVLSRWARRLTKFKKANITTIAVPLINQCKPQGGTIRLVGGDGYYFIGDNQDKLRNALRKWIVEDDMDVQYLLTQPRTGVVKAMKEFSETKLEGKGHMLSVFALEENADLSDDAKRLADFLITFHPNLISWPGDESTNRAMWLEGKHLPGEDVSHDNRWVPPGSMSAPVSGAVRGPTMTWEDIFFRWDKALDDLKQSMVSQ